MLKRFLLSSFMVGAVIVPYAISTSGDWYNKVKAQYFGSAQQAPAATNPQAVAPANGQAAPGTAPQAIAALEQPAKPQSIEGYPATDLKEVLHFDGTPAWVMSRWPRVSAGLATLDLQGYRVPLVTGTAQDDLAGSLTYYFDKDQHVKFISFQGATGDPRKLIALVTAKYGFKPEQTNDPGLTLFMVKWNGKPVSELRIRPARLVRADHPHARYDIYLAMRRP
jgi:hypothetical protein